MKVADLFVSLGVKGADVSKSALSGVKTGLSDVKSMSLEAKAAIAAVIYGLERMMSQSAQMGTGLLNFSSLTGMSTKSLQQWQYAARQAGVSSEELTGNLKAVQNSMSNMLLGKGAPEGMAMLANKVGFDPARARDTLYVMGQLQKFAQTVPQDVGNQMLKSFGLSEGVIAGMRRNTFNEKNFKNAPTFSEKEVTTLNKVDVAWANLGQKIQMAFGHMTAKDGLKMVSEISKMATEVLKLVEALAKLADRIKVFEKMGKLFSGLAGASNDLTGYLDGKRTFLGEDIGKDGKTIKKHAEGGIMQKLLTERHSEDFIYQFFKNLGGMPAASNQDRPVEINQTLNFQHDGKDAQKTGNSVHKAVKDAYRQMQAQSQGS